MKCKRIGCTNQFKGTNSALVHVYDERKVTPSSGDYIGKYDKRRADKYDGHKERWCAKCIENLEPNKYLLTYFVDSRKLKMKRTKRAVEDHSILTSLIENAAPIVPDVVTIDAPEEEVEEAAANETIKATRSKVAKGSSTASVAK